MLLSVSRAPFGLCSGSARDPLELSTCFRVSFGLRWPWIQKIFSSTPYLREEFWLQPGFYRKPLLGRTQIGSRPKRFFKGERHQHREMMLDASFLLSSLCSMLLHFGGSLLGLPCIAFNWLLRDGDMQLTMGHSILRDGLREVHLFFQRRASCSGELRLCGFLLGVWL